MNSTIGGFAVFSIWLNSTGAVISNLLLDISAL